MNEDRIRQAAALLCAVLEGHDKEDRMNWLREIGLQWASVLNAGHTPKDTKAVTNGLLPYEVVYLCQTVVSNCKDHSHASMGLTVICNMVMHGR